MNLRNYSVFRKDLFFENSENLFLTPLPAKGTFTRCTCTAKNTQTSKKRAPTSKDKRPRPVKLQCFYDLDKLMNW